MILRTYQGEGNAKSNLLHRTWIGYYRDYHHGLRIVSWIHGAGGGVHSHDVG